ncbi:helix-turn-helix domain-containing protein [Mucilaginibacter ginsenosidivorax]|uniref:Helix-turn-helix domain-containing protein n=1 Tax=Mucilaginibacter ginsenosidivorax TaxID=862126 RepID=A0A5B8W3X9_9SPHI|nr:AraC family transcriptional regulator [Mucilaginibacter ginsenosidivorax]QEC78534.1 helix-turn-helix domain-containing protein [Mucilaginibacter ginsenosidivorax]
MIKYSRTLFDPHNGNLAFSVSPFDSPFVFDKIQRHNYYTIILVLKGGGQLISGFSKFSLSGPLLCCFAPYQPYFIECAEEISGVSINFHPDFFCIHRHQNEIASNGLLFNNIYQPPLFKISDEDVSKFSELIGHMQTELLSPGIAQQELLVLYLKIVLINAIRIKTVQHEHALKDLEKMKEPAILYNLQEAIEKCYREKHSASDYARMLNISPNALARIVKTYFNKPLTDLIHERIIIEAKRELYLTSKPVKAIAYSLGFSDEYYFSRFFKKSADVSPHFYRDAVGSGREALL